MHSTVLIPSPTYGTISYYPNLLVSQVVHRNGVTDTQGNDPFSMRRPSSEGAASSFASWSSGAYTYDGSGNITRIGTSSYTYDPVSRLTSGTLFDGPTGGGTQKTQSYTFDSFGNLTNIAGTSGRATPTSSATNRLNGAGTVYDAAGNLINWNGAVYVYDHFNQMTDMTSGSEHDLYSYTVDDERVWSYDLVRNISHWTLRDLGGKVLRDYLNNNGTWGLQSDYLYRDGLLLAAETRTGQFHYHLDHLGTPRLITSFSGTQVAYHAYYPFGEEATAFNQDTEPMKFTGHERDLASPSGPGDDLDYMHARHESPVTGRFLSVDPKTRRASRSRPQIWNRYVYSSNNPLVYIDPDGREQIVFASKEVQTLVAGLEVRSPMVRATLALYRGPGTPDLTFQKGDAGKDNRNAKTIARQDFKAIFDPNSISYDGNLDKIKSERDLLPATGKYVAGAKLQSAIITVGSQETPGTREESLNLLHELGHADKAARDPVGFVRDGANDMELNADGSPKEHDKRPLEEDANKYQAAAARESGIKPPV